MFIVIQDLNAPHNCDIVPEDAVYPATKKQVYGPASRQDCEAWMKKNCGQITE